MFEQSTVTQERKTWTFMASITMQTSAVAALVALSMMRVELLAPADLHRPLTVPFVGRTIKDRAVEVVETTRSAANAAVQRFSTARPFTAPSRVPAAIADINDIGVATPTLQFGEPGSTAAIPGGIADVTPTPTAAPPPAAPAPKPVEKGKPVTIGGHVLEARIIHRVMPVYPPLAKQARVSGTVRLMSVIAVDGTVQKLEVVSGHPLLIQAALDAVKQWRYRPTLLNGRPTEVVAPIDVHFTLQ